MKKLILLLIACAIPALPQCGSLAVNPVTGELNCTGGSSVGGITVTGTPTVGMVPTATSATTASWQFIPINPGTAPGYAPNQTLAGCGIEYVSGLTFSVGQCTYTIAGITYTSAITSLTATASGANPRISAIIVDTTGVATVLDGTPAASPAAPTTDPATQLPLTLVYIGTSGTTPTGPGATSIYEENTEWTSAVTANFNAASTSNPYRGTKDIEATTAVLGNNVTLTKPTAGTEILANYNALVFYIRSKATWPTGTGSSAARSLSVFWLSGSTVIGSAVTIRSGQFGFDSSVTSTYQQISIPTSLFATGGTAVTTLKFLVAGNGGSTSIGFYLDAISLQSGGSYTAPTLLTVNTISSPMFCADAGANDTYACILTPLPTGYVIGDHYLFKANTINTGAATINFNAMGAKTIKKVAGGITTTLADGDICAGQIVEISWDGTNMQMLSPTCATAAVAQQHAIGFSIGDGVNVITTGDAGTYPSVAFSCTITQWDISAKQSGSITIDIWKKAAAIPTGSDKISASAPVTLSTAQLAQNGSRTSWSNTVTSGDVFGFSVATVTTLTHVDGVIYCQ